MLLKDKKYPDEVSSLQSRLSTVQASILTLKLEFHDLKNAESELALRCYKQIAR